MSATKTTLLIITIIALCVGCLVTVYRSVPGAYGRVSSLSFGPVALPWIEIGVHTASVNTCNENRRQIDSAVQQYIIENQLDQFPAELGVLDLVGPDAYIQRMPRCPDGGKTYTIVNERSVCSLPEHSPKL